MKKCLILILIMVFCPCSYAETVLLKSGETINGKIIERTNEYIKIDSGDVPLTYYLDEIDAIDGQKLHPAAVEILPHTGKTSSDPEIKERILEILQHLGYPENKRPAIEKEVLTLLAQIDYPHLKIQAVQAKSNPGKLRKFVTKLGRLIDKEGYLDIHSHQPLLKLLTTSFVDDNLSQEILTSSVNFGQKVESIKALGACTAISQLGSILLELLGINGKIAYSPAHVFNCIHLDYQHALFADFSNQIFKVVDINKYYLYLASRTMLLKEIYRITPERLIEINAQLPDELQSDSLPELLNFLYSYIYISDDYATTPAIFLNLGDIYAQKGNYGQAIFYYNKAIELNPDYPEAYHGRGIAYNNEGNLDQAASDISKAIELFPEFAQARLDRANIYSSSGDIDKAIEDLNQAIITDPNFAEAYLDRGNMYSNKSDLDQAISDYGKAIAIDPYYSDAYKARAQAFFSKQEYALAWKDIHTVEGLGDSADPDLVDKLKAVSTHKIFMGLLIGAPVLIFLIFRFF